MVLYSHFFSKRRPESAVDRVETYLRDKDSVDVTDGSGRTMLYAAAEAGNTEVVTRLLRWNADVDKRGRDQRTPLHVAVFEGFGDVVALLLAAGADVNAADCKEATPLHVASLAGDTSMLRLLLACGANILARNERGETPLEVAAKRRHDDATFALSLFGTPPRASDSDDCCTRLNVAGRSFAKRVDENLSQRMDSLEKKLDDAVDSLEKKLDDAGASLEKNLDDAVDSTRGQLDDMLAVLQSLQRKIESHERDNAALKSQDPDEYDEAGKIGADENPMASADAAEAASTSVEDTPTTSTEEATCIGNETSQASVEPMPDEPADVKGSQVPVEPDATEETSKPPDEPVSPTDSDTTILSCYFVTSDDLSDAATK
eukprot:scaffold1616_cov310-Pinguiococcus_pyrenoidosus.AAC.13